MANKDGNLLAEIERDLLDGKPLADVLRKVIVLGGRLGSGEMRDWASLELNGYAQTDVPIPNYRHVPAGIFLDALVGPRQITGQRVGLMELPEWLRNNIGESVELPFGVGELEHLVTSEEANVKMSLPSAGDVVAVMNSESTQPFQQILAIYWKLSVSSVQGVVDKIRTKLAELVAELRANMPTSAEGPSAEQATAAVHFLVTGKRSNVIFTNSQATGGGNSLVTQTTTSPPGETASDPSWWTFGHKVGAMLVGAAVIAGTVIAWLAYINH